MWTRMAKETIMDIDGDFHFRAQIFISTVADNVRS